MKPFRKDAWELAAANSLPPEYEAAAHLSAWMTAHAGKLPHHLAAVRPERDVGDDGGVVAQDVDMRAASGQDDGTGEEGPVPVPFETVPCHDEGRPAVT